MPAYNNTNFDYAGSNEDQANAMMNAMSTVLDDNDRLDEVTFAFLKKIDDSEGELEQPQGTMGSGHGASTDNLQDAGVSTKKSSKSKGHKATKLARKMLGF